MNLEEKMTTIRDESEALLEYANGVTGEGDSRLGDAIKTLSDGYGQGGGGSEMELIASGNVADIAIPNKATYGTDSEKCEILVLHLPDGVVYDEILLCIDNSSATAMVVNASGTKQDVSQAVMCGLNSINNWSGGAIGSGGVSGYSNAEQLQTQMNMMVGTWLQTFARASLRKTRLCTVEMISNTVFGIVKKITVKSATDNIFRTHFPEYGLQGYVGLRLMNNNLWNKDTVAKYYLFGIKRK